MDWRASSASSASVKACSARASSYCRTSRDPNVKMVVFEDTAALAGIALAAGGIGFHQLTGQSFWDPVASILIGVLLVTVAVWMARDTSDLLIGASAKPKERETLERVRQTR